MRTRFRFHYLRKINSLLVSVSVSVSVGFSVGKSVISSSSVNLLATTSFVGFEVGYTISVASILLVVKLEEENAVVG